MKIIINLFILLLVSTGLYSQNASTYFPTNTGYKWFYKNTPLDSLSNPNYNLSTYQVDSFATNVNYNGLPASLVLSQSGLTNINQQGLFTDSVFYNFQSTNGFYFLNPLSFITDLRRL